MGKEKLIEINGERKSISKWARQYDLDPRVFSSRLKRNWTGEKLLKEVKARNEAWIVLNVEMHEIKNEKRIKEIEHFVIESIRKHRKQQNKAKYRNIKFEITKETSEASIISYLNDRINKLEFKVEELCNALNEYKLFVKQDMKAA